MSRTLLTQQNVEAFPTPAFKSSCLRPKGGGDALTSLLCPHWCVTNLTVRVSATEQTRTSTQKGAGNGREPLWFLLVLSPLKKQKWSGCLVALPGLKANYMLRSPYSRVHISNYHLGNVCVRQGNYRPDSQLGLCELAHEDARHASSVFPSSFRKRLPHFEERVPARGPHIKLSH